MWKDSSVDLDEIAEHLDHATQYEGYIVSLCPFHDEHRPSFFVYPDKYRCASCGASGSTKQLLAKISGIVATPSFEDFSNPFSRWLSYRTLAKTLKLAWESPPSTYLRARGIEDKVQKKLGLGILENWITFPVRDESGKIIGAVARRGENNPSTSKYVIPKGQDANLLYTPSWERISRRKTIYITFGILDAISLHILGASAFSTTCGMQMDTRYLDKIRKRIVFIPDKGEEAQAQRFASKLGWRGAVMRCHWTDDFKDVNDLLMAGYTDIILDALDIKEVKP